MLKLVGLGGVFYLKDNLLLGVFILLEFFLFILIDTVNATEDYLGANNFVLRVEQGIKSGVIVIETFGCYKSCNAHHFKLDILFHGRLVDDVVNLEFKYLVYVHGRAVVQNVVLLAVDDIIAFLEEADVRAHG